MARLMLEGPKELKAITVNGQIIVETDDDRERWEKVFIGFSHHNCSQEKSREGSQKEIQVKLRPNRKKTSYHPLLFQMGHWEQQQGREARCPGNVDYCERGEDGGREGAGDLPVEPADQGDHCEDGHPHSRHPSQPQGSLPLP